MYGLSIETKIKQWLLQRGGYCGEIAISGGLTVINIPLSK